MGSASDEPAPRPASGPGGAGVPAPVGEAERIAFWDLLRGIAVGGILVVNIRYMALSAPILDMSLGLPPDVVGLDRALLGLVMFAAETKFVTVFSLLFGVGLGLLSEKAIARGASFPPFYLRRLGALAVFGVLHGTLLWFGDILTLYAILGCVAMWFRHLGARALLIWAGSLLAVNWGFWIVFGCIDPLRHLVEPIEVGGRELVGAEALEHTRREISAAFTSGDFGRMVRSGARSSRGRSSRCSCSWGPALSRCSCWGSLSSRPESSSGPRSTAPSFGAC